MIGSSLNHYQITAKLGAGGMGEVYRARDTRLGRDVAIKVLPDSFARDKERLARFAREAQVLASLNHASIAAIYGLEESGGTKALVLELVEGETLAQRLRRGPLPVDEAIDVALRIAEALEAAHEKGIIHRDLKPANVKYTGEGKVKVLDFGLAKLVEESGSNAPQPVLEDSPTVLTDHTVPGTILGTAAYMSPEQAKGKPLDKRTDIWSFGCVLYECLTAQRVFGGETATDSIGAVLHKEPDWAALPKELPPTIPILLRKCLAKDRKHRLHDIADARVDLEAALGNAGSSTLLIAAAADQNATRKNRWRVWLIALPWALAALATAGFLSNRFSRTRTGSVARPVPQSYTLNLVPDVPLITMAPGGSSVVVAPDCSKIVYLGRKEGVNGLHWKRINDVGISDVQFTFIPGSSRAWPLALFSPQSDRLAFFNTGEINVFSFQGGLPQTIARVQSFAPGGQWASDDRILFATKDGIYEVEAKEGSTPKLILVVDKSKGETQLMHPQFMPGAKAMIFTVWQTNDVPSIEALDLTTKTRKKLGLTGSWNPLFYPVTGHLLYGRDDVLWARQFDPLKLEFTGPEISLLNDLGRDWGARSHQFSIANNGTLIYARGHQLDPRHQLVWVRDRGDVEVVPVPAADYAWPRLAPDGKSVVLTRRTRSGSQIVVINLAERQTIELAAGAPLRIDAFAHDGTNVFFNRIVSGELVVMRARADGTGNPEEIYRVKTDYARAQAISPDGRFLAMVQGLFGREADILLKDLNSPDEPRPFANTPAHEVGPSFSPDGRWIAYTADAEDRNEAYVRKIHAGGPPTPISKNGGRHPIWSRDGSRLYYRSSANEIMMVKIKSLEPLELEAPVIFAPKGFMSFGLNFGASYDVFTDQDGDRLLMLKSIYDEPEPQGATHVTVLVHFDEFIREQAGRKSRAGDPK